MKWDILAVFVAAMSSVLVIAWFARRATAGALAGGGAFMDEFFVAGRSLGPLILAATFFTTIASAGTFIGYPGLAYQNGLTVIMTGINQITMFYLTFGLVGKRMAIVGKRTGAVTFTDLLRNRFDHPLVVLGSTAAILVFFVAFMVAQFAGAARILQAVAGVPYLVGIAVFAGVVATTVILGGFQYALESGDCTVHHGLLLHAAGGNRRSDRRRAYVTRWAGDDVVYNPRPNIQPMLYDPEIPSGAPLDSSLWLKVWSREPQTA